MVNRIYTIATILFVACTVIEPERETYSQNGNASRHVLTASLEGNQPVRSFMDPRESDAGYKVFWSPEDHLAVFLEGCENQYPFRLKNGEGTATGIFEGYVDGDEIIAVSPGYYGRNSDVMYSASGLFFSPPTNQSYSAHTADPQKMYMVARGNNWNLEFKHLMSYLVIPVCGLHTLTTVELHANEGRDNPSMRIKVCWDEGGVPSLDVSKGQEDKEYYPVVLDCSGVTLDPDIETELVLAVVPQVFHGGFTVTFNTLSGSMSKTITEDFSFERGKAHRASPVQIRLDAEKEPSSYLMGSGTVADPFQISSLRDLLYMSARINLPGGTIHPLEGTPVAAASAHYRQTQDISLASVCGSDVGNWSPIADANRDESICFYGSYDGDGHAITNLYIDHETDRAKGDYALFGQVSGEIRNLTVSGKCVSYDGIAALLCANARKQGSFVNCTVSGFGAGTYIGNAAGVCYSADVVENCRNMADVVVVDNLAWNGEQAAGIVCLANIVRGCVNHSSVRVLLKTAYNGSASGIATISGLIANCSNYGQVISTSGAAGISYGSHPLENEGAKGYDMIVVNCVNAGEVTTGYNQQDDLIACGGIIGRSMGGVVSNCLNIGQVSSGGAEVFMGSIAGMVTNRTEFNQCYWYFDNDGGCEQMVIESSMAIQSGGRLLTGDQIKGLAAPDAPLYVSVAGDPYGDVVDAMNAWAADHNPEDYYYSQWVRDNLEGYPSLTSLPAVSPGSTEVFLPQRNNYDVSADGGTINLTIVSSNNCQISSSPEWLSSVSAGNLPITESWTRYDYVFSIDRNPDSVERIGQIVFSDGRGAMASVTVHQKEQSVPGNWMQSSFVRKSLLAFTCATWCGNCPRMLRLAEQVQSENPGQMEVAVLHSPTSDLAFSGTYQVMRAFGETKIPTGFLNFDEILFASDDLPALLAEQQGKPTKIGIDLSTILEGRSLHLEARLLPQNSGSYKISVWLLEDGLVGYQSDYVNGASNVFVHDNTVFQSLTPVLGEDLSAQSGEVLKMEYDYAFPTARDISKTRVLVFVWVRQADGQYVVENCSSVHPGENAPVQLK